MNDRDHGEREARFGTVAAAGGAILFGTSYVATAFALRSFTPLSAALWRGAAGAIAMLVYLAVVTSDGGRPAARRPAAQRPAYAALWRYIVLGVLGGALFIVCMNVAVAQSGAAIASFVAGLYAVLAALLAPPLLGERLRPAAVAGFAACLAGTALLADPGRATTSAVGIAAGLSAAVSFALYLVLSRRWSAAWGLRSEFVTLGQLVSTAVAIAAIEFVRAPGEIVPSAVRLDAAVAIAWLAVAVGVGATLLVLFAVSRIQAARSSAFLLLNPPAATLLAWLLLGESLNLLQLAGGALVLGGIAVATIRVR